MTGILNALLGFLRPSAAGPYVIIQTFTSSTTWVCPGGVTEVEYLVVAGGGGGGRTNCGAGGGAGGYRTNPSFAVTAGTSYTITVGAGGAGNTNGSNSVFSTILAVLEEQALFLVFRVYLQPMQAGVVAAEIKAPVVLVVLVVLVAVVLVDRTPVQQMVFLAPLILAEVVVDLLVPARAPQVQAALALSYSNTQ
jgi:hypothetical protein